MKSMLKTSSWKFSRKQSRKDQSTEDRSPTPEESPTIAQEASFTVEDEDGLCARCAALDLKSILRKKVILQFGELVTDLETTIAGLEDSECSLCQLFASVGPRDTQDTENAQYCHLRAFSARSVFTGLQPQQMVSKYDLTVLGVVGSDLSSSLDGSSQDSSASKVLLDSLGDNGFLCPLVQQRTNVEVLGVREVCSQQFDVDFVRDCLSYCGRNHPQSCEQRVEDPLEMNFLRVIDCETKTIIPAPPDCQYVALSYVWNSIEESVEFVNDSSPVSPSQVSFPLLIEDSMTVTAQTGFKYLWVDRYCIDQDDKKDKHNQIRKMDLIYANARLTIISATSKTQTGGLPGVSKIGRLSQPRLELQDTCLVATLPSGKKSVADSKWASRGWTYQEGILSKRRLIFTDYQVFFECNGMHCAESLILPLNDMHGKISKMYRSVVPQGPLGYSKDPSSRSLKIMEYISAFSKRDLSYPEDRLNAMRGIFNICTQGSPSVHQIMGIPIIPQHSKTNYLGRMRSNRINRRANREFSRGLTWFHPNKGQRVPHFPSWTWAGWSGDINNQLLSDELGHGWDYYYDIPEDPKISLRGSDGLHYLLPNLEEFSGIDRAVAACRIIQVEADMFPCSAFGSELFPEDIPKKEGEVSGPSLDKVTVISCETVWDKYFPAEELSGKHLLGICIGNFTGHLEHTASQHCISIIFVMDMGEYYERVAAGYLTLSLSVGVSRSLERYSYYRECLPLLLEWLKDNAPRQKIKIG